MEQVVPWRELCVVVEPWFYPRPGNGRRPIGLERMLRLHWIAVAAPNPCWPKLTGKARQLQLGQAALTAYASRTRTAGTRAKRTTAAGPSKMQRHPPAAIGMPSTHQTRQSAHSDLPYIGIVILPGRRRLKRIAAVRSSTDGGLKTIAAAHVVQLDYARHWINPAGLTECGPTMSMWGGSPACADMTIIT
jgi:hypothetical protein